MRRACAVAVALAAAYATLGAHDFSASESVLTIDDAVVRSRLSINLLDFPGVDLNGDERISYDELDKAIERIFESIKEHYTLAAPDAPGAMVAERSDVVDEHVLRIEIRFSFTAPVRQLRVTSTLHEIAGATHQHVVSANINGELQRDVLDATHTTASFDARRITGTRILVVAIAAAGLIALSAYRFRASRRRRPSATS